MKNLKSKPFPVFFYRNYESCRIFRGFEQLSSTTNWRVICEQTRANRDSERLSYVSSCITDENGLSDNLFVLVNFSACLST